MAVQVQERIKPVHEPINSSILQVQEPIYRTFFFFKAGAYQILPRQEPQNAGACPIYYPIHTQSHNIPHIYTHAHTQYTSSQPPFLPGNFSQLRKVR